MKIRFLLSALLIVIFLSETNAQYSRQDAISLVTTQFVQNDISTINIFASLSAKSGNSSLPLLDGNSIQLPYDSNWVFFIDDHPSAAWCHSCRYIFVDANDGKDTVLTDLRIYPLNISQDFEVVSKVPQPDPCDPIYTQPMPVSLESPNPNSHLFAVIIAGYEDDTAVRQTQTWNDVSAVYTTLEQVYGYKKENIFVHFSDGTAYHGKDLDGGLYSKDIDYAAYKDTIYHTFKCLAGIEFDPNIPKLNTEDQLFVYADDHGDGSATHSWIMLHPDPNNPGPFNNLYDTTLARWVKDIYCGQMIFLFEQCRSGGFLDDLQPQNSDKCKNRSIYTSVAANEDEWMDYHISDQQYGEFIFYWTAAIRGYFPDINNLHPWLTGFPVYDTINYPNFPYRDCFPGCQSHPYYNPDRNDDGVVTMEEAFYYTNDMDSWSDSLFFCPDSAALFVNNHPKRYKNIGFQEDLQSMAGLTGKVSVTQNIVNRSYLIGGPLIVDGNSTLNFTNAGQDTAKVFFIGESAGLTIKLGSTINTGANMVFSGSESNTINIDGDVGNFTQVKFENLEPDGYFAGLSLNNHNLNTMFTNVRFRKTGLMNSGEQICIKQGSVFTNCGQLTSNFGHVSIQNSAFNGTSIYLNNVFYPQYGGFSDSLTNNTITPSINHDAINVSNCDHAYIQGNEISGASAGFNGIGLFYSGHGASNSVTVRNNTISFCQTGLLGYNTNALIHDNHITNNDIGIKSVNYSNLRIVGEHYYNAGPYTQAIFNNLVYGIYSYSDFPYIRYNKIYNDSDFTNCLIYIDGNEQDALLSEVVFDVRNNCWKNNQIPSQLCSIYGSNATFLYAPYFCFAEPIPEPEDPPEDMLLTGDSLFQAGNFEEAQDVFHTLIENYPTSVYSQTALKELYSLEPYTSNDFAGLRQYYLTNDSILSDSVLSSVGRFLANRCNINLNQYDSAISWYENVIMNPRSEADSVCAIIDIGDLYLHMNSAGSKANFIGSLSQYMPESPNRYCDYRDSLLSLIPFPHKKKSVEDQTDCLLVGHLYQNKPNPFSNETLFSYSLPEKCSEAWLIITDNMGRICQSIPLVDISKGFHSVGFYPDGLSVGLYTSTLLIDGVRSNSQKMIYIN